MEGLYSLSPRAIWTVLKDEHFSFWMVCGYLVLEYFRPQSIIPALDVVPWDKLFVGLCAVSLLADPQRRWVRNRTNLWMTLFLGVIVFSSFFAEYPTVSWSHWFDFFGWYVIYFLIINTVTTSRRYFIFIGIFLLASFKLSLFGAKTWVLRGFGFRKWGIQGPPGFFENSGELSIQMLMFAPIAYELALFFKSRLSRTGYWIAMAVPVTGVMTVLGASSRGAQIALAYQAYRTKFKGKLNLKLLVVLAAIAWGCWALLPDAQKARFLTIGDDKSSQQRLYYWQAGVRMIEKHPLLGVGYFNFQPYFAIHESNEILYGVAQLPHNIFVQVGTDAGLIGLGVFLMLIRCNLRTAREIQLMCAEEEGHPSFAGSMARGLSISTWGFVIAGQFVTVTYYPFLWINLALTVSLANIVARSAQQVREIAHARQSAILAQAVDSPGPEPAAAGRPRPRFGPLARHDRFRGKPRRPQSPGD